MALGAARPRIGNVAQVWAAEVTQKCSRLVAQATGLLAELSTRHSVVHLARRQSQELGVRARRLRIHISEFLEASGGRQAQGTQDCQRVRGAVALAGSEGRVLKLHGVSAQGVERRRPRRERLGQAVQAARAHIHRVRAKSQRSRSPYFFCRPLTNNGRVMSGDAQKLFNDAFDSRFKDLQSMFETPSTDMSALDSPEVQKLLAKLSSGAGKSGTESCAPCAAFAKPLPCASPPSMLKGGSGLSWLLVVLLVAGVFLVVYGLLQLFRSSSERNRAGKVDPRAGSRGTFGAPHLKIGSQGAGVGGGMGGVGAGAVVGGAAQAQPMQGSQGLDEEDPDKVIPDPSEAGVTFVFFHATWCGHCKQFRPIFEEAAKAAAGKAKFKAVVSDVLQKSKHAEKVPIRGFPTVVAFVNGQQADTLVGNQGKEALAQFIQKYT